MAVKTLCSHITSPGGSPLFWNDLVIPAQGINLSGTPAPPTPDTALLGDGCLLFSNTVENNVAVQFQMPHDWCEGTDIHLHMHWCKTTADTGTVLWDAKWSVAKVGTVFPAMSAYATASVEVANADTADLHAISEWAAISMTGNTLSTIVKVVMRRDATNGSDTYDQNAKLLGIDVHYQIDAPGSLQELLK